MLVLTRKPEEVLVFDLQDGRKIEVLLVSSLDGKTRLGITAPQSVRIHRKELLNRPQEERAAA